MFTESQRAELRLRMLREKAEALLEELTRAEEQAEELIRRSGEHPDDLRVDLSRKAMHEALAAARRKLANISAMLDQVERGEVDPAQIDFEALEGPGKDDRKGEQGPGNPEEGP